MDLLGSPKAVVFILHTFLATRVYQIGLYAWIGVFNLKQQSSIALSIFLVVHNVVFSNKISTKNEW